MSLSYKNGSLSIGIKSPIAIETITSHFQDAFYVYDLDLIKQRFFDLHSQLKVNYSQIHYAVKANFTPALLEFIASLGVGADVVSSGELKLALSCGFKPQDIIYSGVSKSKTDLEFAVQQKIGQINVESLEELKRLGEITATVKSTCSIGLRLNPNVNAETHPYIATGFRDNKFGIELDSLGEAKKILTEHPHITLRSLALHIGSQLIDFSALDEAIDKTLSKAASLGVTFDVLDIGGGIGIFYERDFFADDQILETYSSVIRKYSDRGSTIHIEPGRFVVARAGSLLGRIEYIKKTPYKNFALLNTGMHHLIRPALYGAQHRVFEIAPSTSAKAELYDVVGPICESSDFLAKSVKLTNPQSNDWLAIADAGAYGVAMASHYNLQPWPHTVFIENGEWTIQKRQLKKILEITAQGFDER